MRVPDGEAGHAPQIWSMRVGLGRSWWATMEMGSFTTLEALHHAIQRAVRFDSHHL